LLHCATIPNRFEKGKKVMPKKEIKSVTLRARFTPTEINEIEKHKKKTKQKRMTWTEIIRHLIFEWME